MRVLALLTTALSASGIALAVSANITLDETYDNENRTTTGIACSFASSCVATKGYKTIGALPSFPYVGAIPAIAGWSSPMCGTCWRLTYEGESVVFTAINSAKTIQVSKATLEALTDDPKLKHVKARYQQVSRRYCGF